MSEITKRKNQKKESRLSAAISRYMILKGFLVVRINSSGSHFGDRYVASYLIDNVKEKKRKSSGFPDRLCLKNNRSVLIEIKTEEGKVSDAQRDFRALAASKGCDVLIARSIDDVIDYVEKGRTPEQIQAATTRPVSLLDAEIARIRAAAKERAKL